MILDESDDFVLDTLIDITAPYIVGLTATALPDLENDTVEHYIVQHMAFHVFDSAIPT